MKLQKTIIVMMINKYSMTSEAYDRLGVDSLQMVNVFSDEC